MVGGEENMLRAAREQRHWSRQELARRAKMCGSTVGAIESGRLRAYPGQIAKLAKALRLAPEVLEERYGLGEVPRKS